MNKKENKLNKGSTFNDLFKRKNIDFYTINELQNQKSNI